MTVNYWLYVSKINVPEAHAAEVVSEIVKASQSNNAAREITGALVFGGGLFGQMLEGSPERLFTLRSSIMTDQRHTAIRTIAEGKFAHRRFGDWSLAYSGSSMVLSRALQRALRDTAHGYADAGAEVMALMVELVTP